MRDAELTTMIRTIHQESSGRFGARRIWQRLNDQGQTVARCTVERLMRRAGLSGVSGSVPDTGHDVDEALPLRRWP
ncbi:IS3 family transposase [Micromonospora marina]|uniref:IS3 family transposase n=1 Tax=Micromonospora marina TaxID=307120 RepID=UPI003453DBA7